MIQDDPRYPNYGRANFGQLAPNMTAANSQPQKQIQQGATGQAVPRSPMMAGLQQAPQRPAPAPPSSGLNKAATGTFGPKTNPFEGIRNRGQVDFGKGGWQGPINVMHRAANMGPSWMTPPGIVRRAHGSNNDYSVDDAGTILQRGYQNSLGRQASPEEIQGQLQNQGLKQGDRFVGKTGIDALLASLGQSDEGKAYANQAPSAIPPSDVNVPDAGFEQPQLDAPVNEMGNSFESPMIAGLQAPSVEKGSGAQSAYQEYVSEFGPDEAEQPLDYETFSNYYNQLPPEALQDDAPAGSGWEGLNTSMLGAQSSPMGLNGFNTERAFAGGDANSVKDAFARAVSTDPMDLRGKSKEEVGAYLASPEFHQKLAAQGIQSRPVPGSYDQIEVKTAEEGWVVKDIVSAAGSPDAAWWWGDVGGAMEDPAMMGMYTGGEEEDGSEAQSPLLSGLTGGANWKTLLDQLMSQYSQG